MMNFALVSWKTVLKAAFAGRRPTLAARLIFVHRRRSGLYSQVSGGAGRISVSWPFTNRRSDRML
jgi:hypothetical protein